MGPRRYFVPVIPLATARSSHVRWRIVSLARSVLNCGARITAKSRRFSRHSNPADIVSIRNLSVMLTQLPPHRGVVFDKLPSAANGAAELINENG
jgi:hypothetical protein